MLAQRLSQMTSKGTVTIPVEMRRALGLEPGDKVEFTREGDRIVLSRPRSVVAEMAGALAAYAIGTSWSDDDWDRTIGEAIAEEYRLELEDAKRDVQSDAVGERDE